MQSSNSVDNSIAKRVSKKGGIGLLGGLVLGTTGVYDFTKEKNNGATNLEAGLSAAGSTTMAALIGPYVAAGTVVGMETLKAAKSAGVTLADRAREMNKLGTARPFSANNFIETKESFTMRQAAMAAIGQARGSAEHAMMGNEASMFH